MANYTTTDTELTSVADAIRLKGGTQSPLVYPTGFVTAIGNIPTGGGTDTSDATMTSGDQMLSGVTAYSKGTKYTGTIQSKSAQTYTPTTSNQTIASGQYLSGAQTVLGDVNLVPSSIKSGVSIFGVSGSVVDGSENLVHFVDYDGTPLHEYTAAQANALTELPSNPSHTGLTAQGWNWTLAQIKEQLIDIPKGHIWVGQNYVTSDEKTHIDIKLEVGMDIVLWFAVKGTAIVDFGDGSSTVSVTGTSLTVLKSAAHTYSSSGSYTIKIDAVTNSSTTVSFVGSATTLNYTIIRKPSGTTGEINLSYAALVREIRIGSNTRIGDSGLVNLVNMDAITLPTSAVGSSHSIGRYAFHCCKSLKYVVIPSKPIYYDYGVAESMLYYCSSLRGVSLPGRTATIGSGAFRDAHALEDITIPKYVIAIGNSAFAGTYGLRSIALPSALDDIGQSAFAQSNIESIEIPSSVTSIGDSCFEGCSALKSVVLPSNASYTSIGASMFSSCSALVSIELPQNIVSLGGSAFYYSALTSVDLSHITSLGYRSFYSCVGLVRVKLPSSSFSIAGNETFNACSNLSSVDGVINATEIKNSFMYYVKGVAKITIGSSCTSIGTYSFGNMYGLKEVHMLPTSPPTIQSSAFWNFMPDCLIYVPYSADHSVLNDYKTATNWSAYSSQIVEEPQ